jgi:hypothetical protein
MKSSFAPYLAAYVLETLSSIGFSATEANNGQGRERGRDFPRVSEKAAARGCGRGGEALA